VSYELVRDGAGSDATYRQIQQAMDEAVAIYNEHTALSGTIKVSFSTDVPTAEAKPTEGQYIGEVRFGGQIGKRTALHELGHVFGSGFWGDLSRDGRYHGANAIRILQEIDGAGAVLNADKQHFWPYGLNFDGDVKSDADFVNHARIVEGIYRDIHGGGEAPSPSPGQQSSSTVGAESILPAGSAGCDYGDAAKYGGYGYNAGSQQSCAPRDDGAAGGGSAGGDGGILPAGSSGCDYTDAGRYSGYGYDAGAQKSCAPLDGGAAPGDSSSEGGDILPAGSDGCDYTDAGWHDGYGYNSELTKSCAPY
jgi:hypothetical protein